MTVGARGFEPPTLRPPVGIVDGGPRTFAELPPALGDTEGRSDVVQPHPAAASLDVDLRALVSELRAVIADLRAENRRLREELRQRPGLAGKRTSRG